MLIYLFLSVLRLILISNAIYLIIVLLPPAAECFKDRTDVQCLHRWQKVLNPELVKGPWSKEVSFTKFLPYGLN